MDQQHYVPVAYLRNFAINPNGKRETLEIWKFDGKQNSREFIEEECVGDCHYSKSGDKGVFDQWERWFAKFMSDGPSASTCLVKSTQKQILAFILHLHLRGVSYNDKTGRDRMEVCYVLVEQLHQIFRFPPDLDPSARQKHLDKVWSVKLLRCTSGELATSDSPVVCYGCDETKLDLLLLPLRPDLCAIAYNRFKFKIISDEIQAMDEERLDCIQVKSRYRALYTNAPLSTERKECIKKIWNTVTKSSGFVDPCLLKYNILGFPPRSPFTFLQRV